MGTGDVGQVQRLDRALIEVNPSLVFMRLQVKQGVLWESGNYLIAAGPGGLPGGGLLQEHPKTC